MDQALVDKAISELRNAYVKGAATIGIVRTATPAVWDWVAGTSSVSNTIVANYKQLGLQILDWATRLKRWATQGKRDDGTAYTWDRWATHGKTLGDAVSYQSKLIWDANPMKAALDAIIHTAKQITPGSDAPMPGWLKLLIGAGIAILGAYVLNSLVSAKREFFPRQPTRQLRGTSSRRFMSRWRQPVEEIDAEFEEVDS